MAGTSNRDLGRLLKTLHGVLAQVADPIHVLKTLLQRAVEETGADRGVFVEVGRGGKLVFRVLHRFDVKDFAGADGRFSRSIFAEVLRSRKALLFDNASMDPRFSTSESVHDMALVSVLCAPIDLGGRPAALIHLEKNDPTYFKQTHLDMLRSLTNLAGPVLETLRKGNELLAERDRLKETASRYRSEIAENREVLSNDWSFGRFVGKSEPIVALEKMVRKAAAVDFPVLITGETGTGKTLLARILHSSGPRAKQALVTVFCPSLEKGMVESELFGHKKGAFTGAESDRVGKIQVADGGTLFLDEIGELPAPIQAKLLRLVHEKTYERVGDPHERRADVRILAATNRDLDVEIEKGNFRRDLYERLNFTPIRVPPLRERREDIPILLRNALDRHDQGRWIEIGDDALDSLVELDHDWPGNVREVEQLAARLVMEGSRDPVDGEDLCGLLGVERRGTRRAEAASATAAAPSGDGLQDQLNQVEREILERAMRDHPDLTRAELADRLGISVRALYKKLRIYGLSG